MKRIVPLGLSVVLVACGSSPDGVGGDTDSGSSIDSAAADSGGPDAVKDSSSSGDGSADSSVPDSALDSHSDSSSPEIGDAASDDVPPHDGAFIDASTLCSPSERAMKWASMVADPIVLPNHAATLDLAGDGFGLTLGEAETKLCASDALGDQFGNGTLVNAWGDSDEVWFNYDPSDGRVIDLHLWGGYIGAVTAKSPDDLHGYAIPIFKQLAKDGAPFVLPVGWMDDPGFPAVADELYRALVHTYAPSITPPSGSNCTTDKTCLVVSFGDVAYFYVKSIGFAFWVDNRNAAEPVPSIPTRIDVELVKP